MIFPERCCFMIGRRRVARIDGPEMVHRRDKLQERRVKSAGFGIHRPTTTAIGIRDQHINFQGSAARA